MNTLLSEQVSASKLLSPHTPSKKFKGIRKRFQPSTPTLFINEKGRIFHLTDTARQLLEYSPQEPVDDFFFSHVHGKNLHQVMRDVAHMVRRGKEQASWMLRLRTGQGHWRWYRAEVTNRLHTSVAAIKVQLRHLYEW